MDMCRILIAKLFILLDAPQLTSEENRLMARSLWATENSPPMDLDYESSQINRILFQKERGMLF